MSFHRVLHYRGRKVFTLQTLPAREEKSKSEQLAKLSGFSLRCRASKQRLRVYPDNRAKGYRSGDVGKIKGGGAAGSFGDPNPCCSRETGCADFTAAVLKAGEYPSLANAK